MEGLLSLQVGVQQLISDPKIILLICLGVFIGIVFGSIPGLTASLGVTILLPFTYAMTAGEGMAILVAVFVGGISGGLISAILLNIPGTPSSVVTCFDGSPMAKQGRAGEALVLGTFASLIGGIISAVALVFLSSLLAKVALYFGPWDYFALGVMGLCVVVGLVAKDIVKGLIMAVIGLILSMVGMDSVSGVARLTFGQWQLNAGFSNLPTMMGMFAFAEIMMQLRTLRTKMTVTSPPKVPLFPKKESIVGKGKFYGVSGLIGTVIGILPGIGQTTAAFISYSQCRSMSKKPELYGTGCDEGVIASETANNAVCGGALIPMLTMGIPGDMVTAILMGGLVMHGLQPGPLLFKQNPDIIGIVFLAYILANVIMYIMQLGLMRVFIKLLKIPAYFLYPAVLLMCIVGTIATNNRIFDVGVMVGIGILSYLLASQGFSLVPMVLGYVLGDIIESNFRTAVMVSYGNVGAIFTRPAAVVFLVVGAFLVIRALLKEARTSKPSA